MSLAFGLHTMGGAGTLVGQNIVSSRWSTGLTGTTGIVLGQTGNNAGIGFDSGSASLLFYIAGTEWWRFSGATGGLVSGSSGPITTAGQATFGNILGTPGGSLSSNTGRAVLRMSSNVTAVGNGADTTEDNLMTYSLLANTLNANTYGIRVTAWGDGVSTADVTTVKAYFGSTVIVSKVLTASQANTWRCVYTVLRTGSNTQIGTGDIVNGGTAQSVAQANASPSETDSGAITIKFTGQRTVTSTANSVRQLGMIVEALA